MKHLKKFFFISLLLLAGTGAAIAKETAPEYWHLNEVKELDNGFFAKDGGDPYVVFPEVAQPICSPKGIQLAISFDPVPSKPLLMELFWSTDFLGFGEENKVFFVVHPHKDGKSNRFIVPLDHTAVFTQIRLDFPEHIATNFKVEEYTIVSLDNPPEGVEFTDTYYSLATKDSLKPDILIPYLFKALKHGPQRLANDMLFLIFWVFLISFLLYCIRLSARKKPWLQE